MQKLWNVSGKRAVVTVLVAATAVLATLSGLAFAGVEVALGPVHLPAAKPGPSEAVAPAVQPAPADPSAAARPARPKTARTTAPPRRRAAPATAPAPAVPRTPAVARQYPVARTTICHHAKKRVRIRGRFRIRVRHVTLRVRPAFVRGHRRHGDTLGSCASRANKRVHRTRAHVRRWHP